MQRKGVKIKEREEKALRLAGLLHDIGHYPFSHAMEDAIRNYYADRLVEGSGTTEAALRHEAVGKKLLESDSEVRAILTKADIDAKDVYRLFAREGPSPLANLVS